MLQDPIEQLINLKKHGYNDLIKEPKILWLSEDKSIALVELHIKVYYTNTNIIYFSFMKWNETTFEWQSSLYPFAHISIEYAKSFYFKKFKHEIDLEDSNQVFEACMLFSQKYYKSEINRLTKRIDKITAKKITPLADQLSSIQSLSEKLFPPPINRNPLFGILVGGTALPPVDSQGSP